MGDNGRGHKISAVEAKEAIEILGKLPPAELSVVKFVSDYFDEMEQSGRSPKFLYDYFVTRGISLGKYSYFYRVWNRVSHAKKIENIYEVRQDIVQEEAGKE